MTAQFITDKDAYRANESVNATLHVDNNTGKRVLIVVSAEYKHASMGVVSDDKSKDLCVTGFHRRL